MAASPGSQAQSTERPLQSARPAMQPSAASPRPRRRRMTSNASSAPAASTATTAHGIQSPVCEPPSCAASASVAIAGSASQALRASTAARGRGRPMAAGRLMPLTLVGAFLRFRRMCLEVSNRPAAWLVERWRWWSTGHAMGPRGRAPSQMNCAISGRGRALAPMKPAISSWARASQRLPFSAVASVASPVTPDSESALQCGM